MQKARVPITNFQYGEISPSLVSRTDSAIYNSSAQSIKNFFIRTEGGVAKRGGFQALHDFTAVTENTSIRQQVRLIPFVFSDDEQYVIAFSHQKCEIFFINPTTGALSLATTLTQDINNAALQWDQAYLHEITYAQGGDILFVSHNTFMCQQIVRTGLNSFQVEQFNFQLQAGGARIYQPYYHFHPTGVTLDPSATTGNGITITTSAPYFDTTGKHVGVSLLYHDSEIQATGNVVDELFVQLDPSAIRTIDGSSTIVITHVNHGLSANDAITIRNSTSVGGIAASNINGSKTVSKIINENEYTIVAGAAANTSEDGGGVIEIVSHAPTTEWMEQSYSELRGYPAAVGFHENRLWFGGTLSQPDTVWASKSGLFYNFDIGTAQDDDALELVMSIGEVATIRHFVSNRDIHIFTAGSEFFIPTFENQPITPSNARVKRQTAFGSSFVRPQAFYGATIFSQIGGKMIRQFVFDDSQQAYKADPISLLSSHLISDPVQMCVISGAVNTAESFVFAQNFTGEIAVYNLNRVEGVAGWTRFETNGSFHSVTAIDNRVFAVIKTDLGSGTNSFVFTELNQNVSLDLGNTYSGSNGVFTVSNFFENGAKVDVISATDYLGEFTVANGQIDVSSVDASLSSCQVGFGFDVELKTNPIDVGTSIGPETGQPRSLSRVILDMSETLSVSVNNKKLIIRKVNNDFSQPRQPVTGKREFYLLGYNKDPQVTVTQTAPMFIQVNGIVAEVSF